MGELIGFPFITEIHKNIMDELNNIKDDRLYYKDKTPFVNMVAGNKKKEKNIPYKILYLNYKYEGEQSIYKYYNSSFRPIAGIKEMNVDYKNKFGSVKKATVTWFCSNKKDLQELTPYFLTGGKSVYLEWGWGFDTSLSIVHDTDALNNIRIGEVEIESYAKNIESFGKFDCVAGIITNYEVTLNRDGTYDCLTEITTPGFLMESIYTNNVSKRLSKSETALANFKTYLQSGKFYEDIYANANKYEPDNPKWNPDWFVIANAAFQEDIKKLYINATSNKNYSSSIKFEDLFFKNISFISWGFIEDVILGNNYNISANKYTFTSLNSIYQKTRNIQYLRSSDLYVCMIPQFNTGTLNLNDLKITLTMEENTDKINVETKTREAEIAKQSKDTEYGDALDKFKFLYYQYYVNNSKRFKDLDYYSATSILHTGQKDDYVNNRIINDFEFCRIKYDKNEKKWYANLINFGTFLHVILQMKIRGIYPTIEYNKFVSQFNMIFYDKLKETPIKNFGFNTIGGIFNLFNNINVYFDRWFESAKEPRSFTTPYNVTYYKQDAELIVFTSLKLKNDSTKKKIKNIREIQDYCINSNDIDMDNDAIAMTLLNEYTLLIKKIKDILDIMNGKDIDSIYIDTTLEIANGTGRNNFFYWEKLRKSNPYIGMEIIEFDDDKKYSFIPLHNFERELVATFRGSDVVYKDKDLQAFYDQDKKIKEMEAENAGESSKNNDDLPQRPVWKDKFTDKVENTLTTIPNELKEFSKTYTGEIRKILVNSEFFRKTILENENIYNGLTKILSEISDACGNYFNFILSNNPNRRLLTTDEVKNKANNTKNIATSWYVFDTNSELPINEESRIQNIKMIYLTADGASPSIASSFGIKTKVSNASSFSAYYSQHASDIYSYGRGEEKLYYSLYRNKNQDKFIDEFGYQDDLETTNVVEKTDAPTNPYAAIEKSMKSDEQGILRKHVTLDDSFNYLYSFLPLYGAGYNYQFRYDKADTSDTNIFYLRGKEGMKIGLYNTMGLNVDGIQVTGLIPLEIDLELQGISGFKIGDCFKINEVPRIYNDNGVFQITNITDSISNTNWTTKLTAGYRVVSEIVLNSVIINSAAPRTDYVTDVNFGVNGSIAPVKDDKNILGKKYFIDGKKVGYVNSGILKPKTEDLFTTKNEYVGNFKDIIGSYPDKIPFVLTCISLTTEQGNIIDNNGNITIRPGTPKFNVSGLTGNVFLYPNGYNTNRLPKEYFTVGITYVSFKNFQDSIYASYTLIKNVINDSVKNTFNTDDGKECTIQIFYDKLIFNGMVIKDFNTLKSINVFNKSSIYRILNSDSSIKFEHVILSAFYLARWGGQWPSAILFPTEDRLFLQANQDPGFMIDYQKFKKDSNFHPDAILRYRSMIARDYWNLNMKII